MSDRSDKTSIVNLLPEVFQSDINKSLYTGTVDNHLTRDDLQRVVGYVGESTSTVIVNRNIVEDTPHRQAFQLAPTMVTTNGTSTSALSQREFLSQLRWMGVDTSNLDNWASTLRFNWIPPVNIDMLVNYQDYFWKESSPTDRPQYITIENTCNKARSKVASYRYVMDTYGETFSVQSCDFVNNTFTVDGKQDDLFISGFVFFTKNSTLQGLNATYWTVSASTFDLSRNVTVIEVIEMLAQLTAPTSPIIGDLILQGSTVSEWNGSQWVQINVGTVTCTISLSEILTTYQSQANCACNQSYGWDIRPWDDNQIGNVIWNTSLILMLSHSSESAWIGVNGAPSPYDIWINTTTNQLLQRNALNDSWVVAVRNISSVLALSTGSTPWDSSLECPPQAPSQWTENNRWIHKTEVQSFSGVSRAQLPILEYDSDVELNEWTQITYGWKYRPYFDEEFSISQQPTMFELEPIRNFLVVPQGSSGWTIILDNNSFTGTELDFTSTFVPGYKFRVTDDSGISEVLTVKTSTYQTANVSQHPTMPTYGAVKLYTVVEVEEANIAVPSQGGGVSNARIEPVVTSKGDLWLGYNVHWVLDESLTFANPCAHQKKSVDYLSPQQITLLGDPSYSYFQPAVPTITLGSNYQEVTVLDVNTSSVSLAKCFIPSMNNGFWVYALAGSNSLRVYVNGIRQYGTYVETTEVGSSDYEIVGHSVYPGVTRHFVTGVQFNVPLMQYDVVRIEVGTASVWESGKGSISVRTIEDDTAFSDMVATGAQPVYRDLCSYVHSQQVKSALNQYPQFNIFDVVSSTVVGTANVFGYKQSASDPINVNVQLRVQPQDGDKNFSFTQSILSADNAELKAFRRVTSSMPHVWKRADVFLVWDGYCWSDRYFSSGSFNILSVIVSDEQPQSATVGAYWYNPTSNDCSQLDSSAGWNVVPMHEGLTDPSLYTVWRTGALGTYAPRYVDSNKTPVPIGSALGDWEVMSQWTNNCEHRNLMDVQYNDLITHFSSILKSQPRIPGLLNGGAYARSQREFAYELGGTIREHNGSFDTLVSAVNVSNVTPISIIEFAGNQYASSLRSIVDATISNAIQTLIDSSAPTIVNRSAEFSRIAIENYSTNDINAAKYFDSSSYDVESNSGVKNWIATSAVIGLTPKVLPSYSQVSSNLYTVVHHDGHRTNVSVKVADLDRIATRVIMTLDVRSSTPLGIRSGALPPLTLLDFESQFGHGVMSNKYWYHVGSGDPTLYVLDCIHVGETPPSITVGSVTVPDGAMYYNTASNVVYVKQGASWLATGPTGSIAELWKPIDVAHMVAETLYNIESKLYHVATSQQTSYTLPTSLQSQYDESMRTRFVKFATSRGLPNPYVNDGYVPTNQWTWNYQFSSYGSTPRSTSSLPALSSWQSLYEFWYGTPYPNVEPWKMQGYTNKPTWWDMEYANTVGTRRWVYDHTTGVGMWANIKVGNVPVGRQYPDGTVSSGNATLDGQHLPTYNYFSVNISNSAVGGYQPDDLLPPYFDTTLTAALLPAVRSLFSSYSQIISPDADYQYGSIGPLEYKWKTSAPYLYDQLVSQFISDPMNFMSSTFGIRTTNVAGLQVSVDTHKVYSHVDAQFHGDYVNGSTIQYRGINQWYVNYNRSSGTDTNSKFRHDWSQWQPKLTYQFNSIVDPQSCRVSNRYFDVIPSDFSIDLINTGIIDEVWMGGINVDVLHIPPSTIQYNNQHAWKFSLSTVASNVNYGYGVKRYYVKFDVMTDEVIGYAHDVVSILPAAGEIDVSGDASYVPIGTDVKFNTSSTVLTVTSVTYIDNLDITRIVVQPFVSVSPSFVEFLISVPIQTSDPIVLTCVGLLPSNLFFNTQYYAIKTSGQINRFMLAESVTESTVGSNMSFGQGGHGTWWAGVVESSFAAMGGVNVSEIWYNYQIDFNSQSLMNLPKIVTGMQSLIDVMRGHSEYVRTTSVQYGDPSTNLIDPVHGRVPSWELEVERFIDWAYTLKSSRLVVSDKFSVAVNISTNIWTFNEEAPMWTSGTQVVVTTTGSLPSPIIPMGEYYVVRAQLSNQFQLSYTADGANIVDVTSVGSGSIYVGRKVHSTEYPSFELNPGRFGVKINTPKGMLSDVLIGPYDDIRVSQALYDQYGRPLSSDKVNVLRLPTHSVIKIRDQLSNDVEINYSGDPYQYLHIGGGHFIIEGYEHFLIFNNRTVSGLLIYDQFLGLSTRKFELDFNKQVDHKLQPYLGGHYLVGSTFSRNMEGAISDIQYLYDSLRMDDNQTSAHARRILGYTGRSEFLDLVNMNPKSQFLFYKGMVQSKGSVNSVKAYINSRRFIDAKLDEYWAWKIAEFGDSNSRTFPEIKLFTSDRENSDVRLEFISNSEINGNETLTESIRYGFEIVSFGDERRWNNFPMQRDEIQTPLFLDADVTSTLLIFCSPTPPTTSSELTSVTHWYDTVNQQLYKYDFSNQAWSVNVTATMLAFETILVGTPAVPMSAVYVRNLKTCDDVRVLHRTFIDGNPNNYSVDLFTEGYGAFEYTRIDSETIRLNVAGLTDVLIIQTLSPAYHKVSPAKLIDTKSHVVVSDMPIWDPARGYHNPVAIYNVDIQSNIDPAKYTNSANSSYTSTNFWNAPEMGTVWMDVSQVGYMPYYETTITPNINDRLSMWGKLAPWANMNVYKWTRSPVHPDEWDNLVVQHSLDSTIPQRSKATGTTKKVPFVRSRSHQLCTIDVNANVILIPSNTFTVGQYVTFYSATQLSEDLELGANYEVISATSTSITISGVDSTPIVFSDTGSGQLLVTKAFTPDDWIKQAFAHVRIPAVVLSQHINDIVGTVTPYAYPRTLPINVVAWSDINDVWVSGADVVDVYKNGQLFSSQLTVATDVGTGLKFVTVPLLMTVSETDAFDVIRNVTLTGDDFNIDNDDGSVLVQRKVETEYSTSNTGEYYFWVTDSHDRNTNKFPSLSTYEIARQLVDISSPYIVVQKPKDEPMLAERYGFGMAEFGSAFSLGTLSEQFYSIPVTYRQVILRQVADYLTDDNRLSVRFTRDGALRNKLRDESTGRLLKNTHSEWMMFRRDQSNTIPRELWDKVTESMVGHTLANVNVRVPALERELYDAQYGTDTQYGLGANQTFAPRTVAIATVLDYLTSGRNTFDEIDIDEFFAVYAFDTNDQIIEAMNAIYTSFDAKHVNAIWFEVLQDALVVKREYGDIMKTSWIALHGVRVLEVGGLFDD